MRHALFWAEEYAMRRFWLAAATFVAALCVSDIRAQQRGFGSGGPNPDDSFNRLLSSYGGSGDMLDLSKIPADQRERTNRFAQMTGTEPLPASGMMSRDQYRDQFNKRMEAVRSRGGFGGGPPGGFGGQPGGFGGQPGGFSGQPAMFGQPQQQGDDHERRFRERDRNQDGKLGPDEISDRMRSMMQQYDKNNDGSIDLNEYKAYMMEQDAIRNQERASRDMQRGFPQPGGYSPSFPGVPGGYPQPGSPQPAPGQQGKPEDEPVERPVVYRFGKLPKEVPSWFEQLDQDSDGQIGLYEWRSANRSTGEFLDMDQNGDGFLTAEEWIRYTKASLERKSGDTTVSTSERGGNDRGGRPGFGGPGGGGFGGPPAGFGGGNSNDRGRGGPPGGFGGFGGGMPGGFGNRGGMPGGDRNRERTSESGRDEKSKEERREEKRMNKEDRRMGSNPFIQRPSGK